MPLKHRHQGGDSSGGDSASTTPRNHRVNKNNKNKSGNKRRGIEKKSPKFQSAIKGRNGNSKAKNRKRAAAVAEHPFSAEFKESLDNSTASIATSLASTISDIHRIRLSRIAAATAQSQEYLVAADETKAKFEISPILSAIFDEQMESFKAFIVAKQGRIHELERERQDIGEAIIQLQKEAQGINPMHSLKQDSLFGEDSDKDVDGDGFLEDVCEKIRGIGRKWVRRMEESERKLAEDALKQRQLAAAAML